MEKKKAVVCTILYTIILIAIAVASWFIKTEDGMFRLWYMFGSMSLGWFIGTRIEMFYKWLTN